MRKIIFGVITLLYFVLSSCIDQPTSISDDPKINVELSKVSKYIPGTDITVQLRDD